MDELKLALDTLASRVDALAEQVGMIDRDTAKAREDLLSKSSALDLRVEQTMRKHGEQIEAVAGEVSGIKSALTQLASAKAAADGSAERQPGGGDPAEVKPGTGMNWGG